MPVIALSARQAVIAPPNAALLGIGVTGVVPSERNCAEVDEIDRKIEIIQRDRSAQSRRKNRAVAVCAIAKKYLTIKSSFKSLSTKPPQNKIISKL
jgi:hypothetical protein